MYDLWAMTDFICCHMQESHLINDDWQEGYHIRKVKASPGLKADLDIMYRFGKRGEECTWENLRGAMERLIERKKARGHTT